MLLELRPNVLRRVQFRSIGGQVVDLHLPSQGLDVVVDQSTAMAGQPVPDQQYRPVDLFPEVLEEIENFLFAHRSFIQTKVELPQRNAGGDGQVVPVELVLQDGRNAPLGPGADSVRPLAETALVYEDDDWALFLGFFLSTGQIFSFQSRMANSLRSRARPTGR